MDTKVCRTCKIEKPIDCFGRLAASKDGYRNTCKDCRREEYLKNADVNKKRSNDNYYKNHEQNKGRQRAYNRTRVEKQREYMKVYYESHKNEIKENVRKNALKRKHEDVGYKLLCNYRTRIYKAVKGIEKSKKTRALIGCSIEELKQHLENQFKDGMSWENYGEWHVDHIRPCSTFNLLNESEMRECFNYKNLQPLWAEENLLKSDKYEWGNDL